MAQVFISYSRKDKEFVQKLVDVLVADKREVWLDETNIEPTAEWLKEIFSNIETSDNFLFVISPDSVVSTYARKEIDHAVLNNKRIVPVLYKPVPDKDVPEAVAKFQRINFTGVDGFDEKCARLIAALDTDLEWKQVHTRLLVRAKEWEREAKDKSFLLRGKDLREAEQWVALSAEKEPKPTTLHSQYILASRQFATRTQRIIIGAVAIAFLIAMGLAVYAFNQKNLAQTETKEAEQQRAVADANAIEAQKQKKAADHNASVATLQRQLAEASAGRANANYRAAMDTVEAIAAKFTQFDLHRLGVANETSLPILEKINTTLGSVQSAPSIELLQLRYKVLAALSLQYELAGNAEASHAVASQCVAITREHEFTVNYDPSKIESFWFCHKQIAGPELWHLIDSRDQALNAKACKDGFERLIEAEKLGSAITDDRVMRSEAASLYIPDLLSLGDEFDNLRDDIICPGSVAVSAHAIGIYQQAEGLARHLQDKTPNETMRNDLLVDIYGRYSHYYLERSNKQAAIRAAKKAVGIRKAILESTPTSITTEKYVDARLLLVATGGGSSEDARELTELVSHISDDKVREKLLGLIEKVRQRLNP